MIAPDDKTFRINIGSREERITIDRLKPARVDPNVPVLVEWPLRRCRPPRRGTTTYTHRPQSYTLAHLQITIIITNYYLQSS